MESSTNVIGELIVAPRYRIKNEVRSCLWYEVARDEILEAHPDQDLLHIGKVALQVPNQMAGLLKEKNLEKVYAPIEDLILIKNKSMNEMDDSGMSQSK